MDPSPRLADAQLCLKPWCTQVSGHGRVEAIKLAMLLVLVLACCPVTSELYSPAHTEMSGSFEV